MGIGQTGDYESNGSWERQTLQQAADECALRPQDVGLIHPDARTARLVKTIESEIVPRLVLSERVAVKVTPARTQASKLPEVFDVQELVRLLLAHDVSVAAAYVETVLERGASLDGICLNLLAPAARELGLLWEEDECDFMQVTVGLCRLHQILRNVSPQFGVESISVAAERRILLAAVPGEQHTFGITVVSQFLLRAGWDVWHEFPSRDTEILEIVRHNWFTVVGLSVGSDTRLESAAALVRAIRDCSRNRNVGVLVGGPVLLGRPELAQAIGADATANDAQQTAQWVERVCLANHEAL
jgi:MerR family transcriptional regulator, light-induced transcriptional regulator